MFLLQCPLNISMLLLSIDSCRTEKNMFYEKPKEKKRKERGRDQKLVSDEGRARARERERNVLRQNTRSRCQLWRNIICFYLSLGVLNFYVNYNFKVNQMFLHIAILHRESLFICE